MKEGQQPWLLERTTDHLRPSFTERAKQLIPFGHRQDREVRFDDGSPARVAENVPSISVNVARVEQGHAR